MAGGAADLLGEIGLPSTFDLPAGQGLGAHPDAPAGPTHGMASVDVGPLELFDAGAQAAGVARDVGGGGPGGDPFAGLDLSLDDLAEAAPSQPQVADPAVAAGRIQGRPPGSGLGSIDLDAVLSEDSGTDVVLPWTSARRAPPSGATGALPPEGPTQAAASQPGPIPEADLALPDVWPVGQTGGAGGSPEVAGDPASLDFGMVPGEGLSLELGSAPAPEVDRPPVAAAPPTTITTRTAPRRSIGAGGAPKVALLAVLLLVLVGVILGQTDYGYFGLNLISGGAGGAAGRRAMPPPGAVSGIARDTKESFLEEVERLERLAKEDEDNPQHRADLLEVLLRFRERYPAQFAAGSRLEKRLKELQLATQMTGQKADMVRVMDLVSANRFDEARVLLDGMVALSAQDPDVLYFYGKVALGQNKPDEALRYFELALMKNPGWIAAKYFLAMTHIARKDVPRARATLDEILAREPSHLPSRLAIAELALEAKDYDGAARAAGEVLAKARAGADSTEQFGAHLVLARVAEARGAPEERLASLRAALGVQPDHEATAVAAAGMLAAAGKHEEALAVLEPCRQKGCSGEAFLVAYAEASYAVNHVDAGDAAVKEGTEKYPNSPTFFLVKGRYLLEVSQVRAAVDAFEEAVKVAPENEEGYLLLAAGLAKEGKLSEAATRLKGGLERVPKSVRMWVALAEAQRDQRDFAAAEESLRRATALDSMHPRAQQVLGLVIAAQGRPEEAARILAALDARHALDRDGVMGLAGAYLALKEAPKARDLLARWYAKGEDDPDMAAEYGRALMESDALQRAQDVLRKLVSDHPSHARAHYYLGLLATRSGDKAKATDSLQRAVQLAPAVPEYRLELARVLLAAGTVDGKRDARGHLDAIVTAYNRGDVPPEGRDADAYMLRGRMLFEEQKYALAMRDFEAALGLAPARLDIMVGFGRSVYELARYDEAAPYFQQVVARDSLHPEANYYLGRIHLHAGRIDAAKLHLERSVQRDAKAFPEAHRQLGLIYKDQGMKKLAARAFERYLANAPKGTAEAEEVRRMLDRLK